MFATRLQPRLNMFSCEIYLQKQCKLFLSFALSLLLFLCDCGALSSPRKKNIRVTYRTYQLHEHGGVTVQKASRARGLCTIITRLYLLS